MNAWVYIVGNLSLGMLGILLWKERIRPDRSRLGGRIAACILAVLGLAGLALPLTYHRTVLAAGGNKEGVFLTEGFDADTVRQFLAAHPDIHDLWSDPQASAGPVPAPPVPVPEQGEPRWPVNKLHVFGYGLTRRQWTTLQPPTLVFHETAPATGVIAADWQRRLSAGERLLVQGRWRGTGRQVKLLLTGLGVILDSAVSGTVTDSGNASANSGYFSLNAVPAQTGRAVYRLLAIAGTDTLEQEEIPVEVAPGRPLRILLLAASPDFENTFLVNWLAKQGQQVASRTAVSRNSYQSSFVNYNPRPLDVLTPSLLETFDVVIADQQALPAAGTAGYSILRRQVEEKGLGLIVKVDSARPGGAGIGGSAQVKVMHTGDSLQPPYIQARSGMLSLEKDSFSRTIVGSTLYGAGKVAFSTQNTTYARMMTGKSVSYAAYWSMLLGMMARQDNPAEQWDWSPAMPRERQPMEVKLQTINTGLPQGLVSRWAAPGTGKEPANLYLAQDQGLPFFWKGIYWPESAGWTTLTTFQGDTSWAYIWPENAWGALFRDQRRQETLAYERVMAEPQVTKQPVKGGEKHRLTVAIPKFWFYLLFLISVFFLWVERKMGGMNGKIIQ